MGSASALTAASAPASTDGATCAPAQPPPASASHAAAISDPRIASPARVAAALADVEARSRFIGQTPAGGVRDSDVREHTRTLRLRPHEDAIRARARDGDRVEGGVRDRVRTLDVQARVGRAVDEEILEDDARDGPQRAEDLDSAVLLVEHAPARAH